MGIIDSFSAEDRVSVKFTDFYRMMKEAARAEVIKELALRLDGNKKTGKVIKALLGEYAGGKKDGAVGNIK